VAERFRALNRERGTVLAERARRADNAWQRFVGLMLSPELPPGDALVLEPCASIHMFFMRYPIDVLFLSEQRPRSGEYRVVGLVHAIRPWRMTRFYRGARAALEIPAGVIEQSGTRTGDTIALEPVGRA
jgi:uncharacterized membrane protein (UPF0127 family)